MNIIENKTVGKTILNENTPQRDFRVEHFSIPYYQRGYRWETNHVEALLDDIHSFILSKEENYCLQPIAVVPTLDEQGLNIWEVIDGQQRLITLYIIFQYIQKPKYSIFFEKRTKSTSFLNNLNEQTCNHENPDFHFMSNALTVVAKWFDGKTKNDISYIDEFYTTVTKKVQVIWYQLSELEEEEKINIFNRLNIGKIPLTDAELVKALLLSKIKYGLTDREANMRQAEISNEWNFIEHELQKDEFWLFLKNDNKDNFSSRIEFIFNIIAGEKSKDYSTYLWFEKEIKNDKEEYERKSAIHLWNETKAVFAKFKSWYNKRTLYHYVGFLLANNYPIKTIIENSKTTKPKFEKWLKNEIRINVKNIDINNLSYGSKHIEKVFLLFNILTIENLTNSSQNKFPFNHYKNVKHNDGGWSIEHIHAQQSESIKDEKAIRTWLEDTLKAIENISYIEVESENTDDEGNESNSLNKYDINSVYVKRINELLIKEKIDVLEFNNLKDELIGIFESSSMHELDNLALLSKKDNSALNNSIFPVKRNKIISLEKEGKFIPPCTRNVFLKFYSNSDNQPYYWSKTDKILYFKAIENVLRPFLTNNKY